MENVKYFQGGKKLHTPDKQRLLIGSVAFSSLHLLSHRTSSSRVAELGPGQEMATRPSYEVSKFIAEHGKAFAEAEFIKKCLTVVVESMCPDKAELFNTISLSR
jgi:hypothetical protein